MKLNIVPARTGLVWVKLGITTFFRQPLALAGLFFMFMAVMSVATLVPYAGSAFALMLLPAATLGLMAATLEASKGKFPMPAILISAFRAGRQQMRAMLILGVLYAAGFLGIMGISALFDGGKFAQLYLVGGKITQELVIGALISRMAMWVVHSPLPAALDAVLACTGAGALARRVAGEEPVLQHRGLYPQPGRLHRLRSGVARRLHGWRRSR
jgi:hypothetical protein